MNHDDDLRREGGLGDLASRPRSTAIRIPPCWTITPPGPAAEGDGVRIVLQPGPGFGTGTHETTQLCLQAIAAFARRTERPFRMLDFGSGSGILAVGAAKLGAAVEAVEIDPRALAHAEENARLNGVAHRIRGSRTLDTAPGLFDLIVANILQSVLLDFAGELAARLDPGGTLVLSGLVSTDVPAITARYGALLGRSRPEVIQLGEWRALLWRPAVGG